MTVCWSCWRCSLTFQGWWFSWLLLKEALHLQHNPTLLAGKLC
jgi:hypothetical protein